MSSIYQEYMPNRAKTNVQMNTSYWILTFGVRCHRGRGACAGILLSWGAERLGVGIPSARGGVCACLWGQHPKGCSLALC